MAPDSSTAPVFDRSLAFMDGPGQVAAAMRAHDWSRSAVGQPDTWPSSLRTVLQIVMTSRYEMWMAWGPERTFFCNDAYLPTLGHKQGWLGAGAAHRIAVPCRDQIDREAEIAIDRRDDPAAEAGTDDGDPHPGVNHARRGLWQPHQPPRRSPRRRRRRHSRPSPGWSGP